MFVTKEEMYKIRFDLVCQMHDYVLKNIKNKNIWITDYIPEQPTKEDIYFYANDTVAFRELCEFFGYVVNQEE